MPIISTECRCDRCGACEKASSQNGEIYPKGWDNLFARAFNDATPGYAARLLCAQCCALLADWTVGKG